MILGLPVDIGESPAAVQGEKGFPDALQDVLGAHLRPQELPFEGGQAEAFVDGCIHPGGGDRFQDIVDDAHIHRRENQLGFPIESGDHNVSGGLHSLDGPGHGHAIHAGHLDVRDHQGRMVLAEEIQPLRAILGDQDMGEPFLQDVDQEEARGRIILHAQNGAGILVDRGNRQDDLPSGVLASSESASMSILTPNLMEFFTSAKKIQDQASCP
jgi:predicted Rdx family selenoprotein